MLLRFQGAITIDFSKEVNKCLRKVSSTTGHHIYKPVIYYLQKVHLLKEVMHFLLGLLNKNISEKMYMYK